MLVDVTPANHLFRVTSSARQWADVTSGKGAHYIKAAGNRYNVNGQKTVYASDTLEAALAEGAYYAALEWQERIGNSAVLWANAPAPTSLSSAHKLWRFCLRKKATVVDVDTQASQVAFHHRRLILRNPSRDYLSTQRLATAVVSPPNANDGLKAPAVRCPHQYGRKNHANYVFIVRGRSLAAKQLGVWDITIEFLPVGGGLVSPTTDRIDWENPTITFAQPAGLPAGATQVMTLPIRFS